MNPVVRLRGAGLRRGGKSLVGGIDWDVAEGERWALLGPNGAGKTSLLELVSTYELPSDGTVEVLGAQVGTVDLREHRKRIGVAGPKLARRLRPELTVLQAVLTGPYATLAVWRQEFADDEVAAARSLLEEVHLDDLADRRLGRLSEGERQRVQLARVLHATQGRFGWPGEVSNGLKPTASPTSTEGGTGGELLLLDEPTAGLDMAGRELVLERLAQLASPQPRAAVLVSHHLEELPPSVTHALLLKGGRSLAQGPVEEVLTGLPLSEAFDMPLRVHRDVDGRWSARRG